LNNCIFPMLSEDVLKLPFYIKCIGGWENQEKISRPEGYLDCQVFLCLNGEGILKIGKTEHEIKKNMVFFIDQDTPHEYYGKTEPWGVHWIAFSGDFTASFLKIMGLQKYRVFNLTDVSALDSLLLDMYILAQSENSMKSLECSALLYRFLIDLMGNISSEQGRQKAIRQKLQPAVTFIEGNFSKKLSLSEISQTISSTPQHLCRLFRQAYSVSPIEYLIKYRVLKAKELIVSPENIKISDIARLVGYIDTSYFCTIFRELEGLSPIEFRHKYKSG